MDSEKLLQLYLRFFENDSNNEIQSILSALSTFIVKKCKEIPSWILFEKVKMVILSFQKLSTQIRGILDKWIDDFFAYDNKRKEELKKLLEKIPVKIEQDDL